VNLAKVLYTVRVHDTGREKDIEACETPKVGPLREKYDLQRLSLLEWYRILRAHHEWTIFQAVRFALWLAR
jgi:hypothetical protein